MSSSLETYANPLIYAQECAQATAPVSELHLANKGVRLADNRRHVAKHNRLATVELMRTRAAIKTLVAFPEPDESIHCVLKGDFALWDFVSATVKLSGQPLDELWIATLGFSKRNIEALGRLIDAGRVKSAAILCSHYFSAAEKSVYNLGVVLCQTHGLQIAAMRTHAKLLLIKTAGRHLVFEASANLRSCHNVEQACVSNDRGLYDFHRAWMQDLLSRCSTP